MDEQPNGASGSVVDDADETSEAGLDEAELDDEYDVEDDRETDGTEAVTAEDFDDEDGYYEDDTIGDDTAMLGVPVATRTVDASRLSAVEDDIGALAAAHYTDERRRVRRKVKAASTGAGAAGAVPVLLQLAGALHLSPEVAATLSSAVALIGALLAGYVTPERAPALPDEVVHDILRRHGGARRRQRTAAHRRQASGRRRRVT